MRVAAKSKPKDLLTLLGHAVTVARAALLKHISQIDMEAHGANDIPKGDWNLLAIDLLVVPGAGIT